MKKISIIWGIVMVVIFACLTVFGFKYQTIKEYHFLEDKMEKYAKLYVENKIKKEDLKKNFKITLEDLQEYKPKAKFEVTDDTCDGYVKVKKTIFGYYYQANITCEKYAAGHKK